MDRFAGKVGALKHRGIPVQRKNALFGIGKFEKACGGNEKR
ncbi:hypothetical protein [Bacillus sp. SD088]|nr:hypothetical protein [Bacillus sp. SD088]